jgi:hypothetical protein
MYESPAYPIFLNRQDWRKKFGPSGEGNKENEEKSASGVKTKSKPFKKNAKKIKNVNSNSDLDQNTCHGQVHITIANLVHSTSYVLDSVCAQVLVLNRL